MKITINIIALFTAMLCFHIGQAQINAPAPSPMCKMEQRVGVTDITFEYSRPSMKGRKLFVDVEKFGKIWRTGANASTKISFSRDVSIEGKKVEAGTYALYTIPEQGDWTIMLYKDLNLGGNVGAYETANEKIRFKVKPISSQVTFETFMIVTDNITHNSAEVLLMWGNYMVPFTIDVNTDEYVLGSIENTLAGPSARDYYTAASYYYNTGKDKEDALEWIQKANDMDAKYWQLRLEAQLLHANGKHEEAMTTMVESSNMAREAGNNGYAEGNDKIAMSWN